MRNSSDQGTDESAEWPYKPGVTPLSQENVHVDVSLPQRALDALRYERERKQRKDPYKPEPMCFYN